MKILGVDWGKFLYSPDVQAGAGYESVDDLAPFALNGGFTDVMTSYYDGEKFAGGFGTTQHHIVDYWTLRARSSQLFNENLYARGLIRRLITNEINTGLTPEAAPDESVIGVGEDSLGDWAEDVENRHGLWSKTPGLCDYNEEKTFGAIQRDARAEALISGDVLVVLRYSRKTKLPAVQLVSGNKINTPLGGHPGLKTAHSIKHGVEFDARGRQVAFWVLQRDGGYKRLPAYGERSGRRLAWLVYGTDKRLDDVRGQPILSLVLQSLKEIDRYRDSTQRKAVINSIMAMFIEKGEDKPSSLPMTGGAVRRGQATTTGTDGAPRKFNINKMLPGMVPEELQHGEKPHLLGGHGTDLSFGDFEEAIIQGVAWANEIPPEILRLSFSNNYSASQAAINEFKIYLNKVWSDWGETFCAPVYQEWLIAQVLMQKIKAPGLLEAWRSAQTQDVFAAWVRTDWYGSIKPSTDMLKQAKGSQLLVANGWSTNAREARITTGLKFSHNVKRLARENVQLAAALKPILELRQELAAAGAEDRAGGGGGADRTDAIVDSILEAIGDNSHDDDFVEGLVEVMQSVG